MGDSNSNAKDPADNNACAEREENPRNNRPDGGVGDGDGAANRPRGTPSTNLSQVDADFALARTIQQQELVYMMLAMRAGVGVRGNFGYGHGEGIRDDQREELDPSTSSDEAYARASQEAEGRVRERVARMLARPGMNEIGDGEEENVDENGREPGGNHPDPREEVDPDELSYEELLALGDVIGKETRGLSADAIASLPSINYSSEDAEERKSDSCAICMLDYVEGDRLTLLSCKHSYHPNCIKHWLQINKVCPVCNKEVSTPAGKS